MNGFAIVGLLGAAVLAFFLWQRGRHRRTGALPPPPEARIARDDGAVRGGTNRVPDREGDGGGNG
ncbi:MAG: hypothetical protein IT562_19525 [Alphaproteobacteria bacterium]|nr:hypothetical protein [Alphaproteobacteria bacterium]